MGEQKDEDTIGQIRAGLRCDSIVIKKPQGIAAVMAKYQELLAQGRREGFTPVIIIPTDILAEFFEDGEAEEPESILQQANSLHAQDLFKEMIANAMPDEEEDDYDVIGAFKESIPLHHFVFLEDDYTAPDSPLIVAKVPTDKPWEVPAWVPVGGFNDCPMPHEMVAIHKYWHEKYGSIPATVSYDTWEVYVERPVSTQAEAEALALEQFGFCNDSVWQGSGTVNALAGSLVNSSVWAFWWD